MPTNPNVPFSPFSFENEPIKNDIPSIATGKNPLGPREYPRRLVTLSKRGSRARCSKIKPEYILRNRQQAHRHFLRRRPATNAFSCLLTQVIEFSSVEKNCRKRKTRRTTEQQCIFFHHQLKIWINCVASAELLQKCWS